MKKISSVLVGSICLLSSVSALAHAVHSYKGEEPPLNPVTIPVFKGGFEFGLGALYLRPTSSNLQYATNQVVTSGFSPDGFFTVNTQNNSENVDPGYNWGFLLQLGYIFPHTANDVQLNWMHLHTKDSDSAAVSGSADASVFVISPLDFPIILDEGNAINEKGKAKYKFDAVDLAFGQYINIGPRLQTRLYAGLRWAKLDNDISYTYQGTALGLDFETPEVISASGKSDSSFDGIGPLFGVSANYEIGYGFGISGNIDLALLVGKVSLDQSASTTLSVDGVFNTTYDADDIQVISPALDARFGLNYNYIMKNGSLIKAELGYQVSHYFDVIETADVTQLAPFGGGDVANFPLSPSTTDFGLSGPYLSITLKV